MYTLWAINHGYSVNSNIWLATIVCIVFTTNFQLCEITGVQYTGEDDEDHCKHNRHERGIQGSSVAHPALALLGHGIRADPKLFLGGWKG